MCRRIVAVLAVFSSVGFAQKATITYKPAASDEDTRPVLTTIVVSPQGTDYALKLEFDKNPWGDECGTRCANATLFLDTDNNANTGLKLPTPKAAETGSDLVLTIQGVKVIKDGASKAALRIKVSAYAESATAVEDGQLLAELNPVTDADRVLSSDTSLYLLIDANMGSIPAGKQLRAVYHPPDSKPLIGMAKGLASPASGRVELFKDGKLTNPPPKKKKGGGDYEKL